MKYGIDSIGKRYPLKKPKQSVAMKKAWANSETRNRIVVAVTKATTTDAYRAKQSLLKQREARQPKRKKQLLRATLASHTYEPKMRRRLESEGWRLLHRGWPDFIAIKGKKIRFIEAKEPNGKLSRHQKEVHSILSKFGIFVEVLR